MFAEGFIVIFIAILVVCYKLWKRTKYWKNKNVYYVEPWIVFGNLSDVIFKKQPMAKLLEHLYTVAGDRRYFGAYSFTKPCIVLKDLDLIKQVTIKHFQSFPAHSTVVSEKTDPILNNTLLVTEDYEKWRKLRTTIAPAFASSKIKTMFKTMDECAKHLIDYLEDNGSVDTFEIKSLFRRYSSDVIGNCVVGISCNSFQDLNNEFLHLAHETMSSIKSFRILIHGISTAMAEVLNVRLIKKECADSWVKFVNKIITSRENGVHKDDMLQLLLKVKHGQLSNVEECVSYQLTNEDITSQLMLLLLAGHDTSSVTLTFAAYELAINHDVQMQLQQEIDVVLRENGNFISYENLMEMKYLDAVVSETLRKWPVVTYVDRRTKGYVIDSNTINEKPLTLECGTKVWIPIYAIHRDPKYYPNPEKFDPRRFLPENKSKIKPFSYLPFGLGPRSCLGSRFGILEIKLLLFRILTKFSIVTVENTPISMTIKGFFLLETKEDCWVAFKPRK